MEMALQLPNNYVELEQDEMMYLDGGASVITTAAAARNSFNTLSTAATTGVALSAGLGLLGGILGKVVGLVTGSWFNALRNHANTAHHQAVRIVASHGANRRVRATISSNWLGWVTGASVVKA